jgi:GntR family transcriptional regulator
MFLSVNPSSPTPLYSQIMEQVRLAVASGRLRPGDQLPTVRDLAVQIQVNPMTISKAYSELEREGLLETARGRGTFVADEPPAVLPSRKAEILKRDIRQLLADAHQLRVPPAAILKMIQKELARFDGTEGGT